jgi:hypothetical protein
MEVRLHSFLTLALYGSYWPASRPGGFIRGKRVDARMDRLQSRSSRDGKGKSTCLYRESNPGRPAHILVITDLHIET